MCSGRCRAMLLLCHAPCSGDPSAQELAAPLQLASMHMLSTQDKFISPEQSRKLAAQFDASRRQILEHDQGQ